MLEDRARVYAALGDPKHPDPVRSGRLSDFRTVLRQLERRVGLLSRAMTTTKGTA